MSEIGYIINVPEKFSADEREVFRKLLQQQGKMQKVTIDKVNRCQLLCVCRVDNNIVSIGAIKPKTNSDFDSNKADLDRMRSEFKVELGYCFTLPGYTGNGFSSLIVKMLIEKIGKENIMASTELRGDNSMTRILERSGFKQYGKPWKSGIHGGALGLFLKFAK